MLDSSTLLQSNESDGWSKERERERELQRAGNPAILVQFLPPNLLYFISVIFPYSKNLFPEDFGIILVQPAAAYRCLVVTGHKPKLEQVSSLVCLPRLSPSKQSSKPRTRNLPSKLQVTTKKSPSDCNGGKGGRCSVRRP